MKIEQLPSVSDACIRITFSQGNKRLMLKVYPHQHEAEARIDNQTFARKRKGTTTAIYSAVYKYMSDLARDTGMPIDYMFATQNQKMRLWALGPGRKIFRWNKIKDPDWDHVFRAYSTIRSQR